MLKSNRPVEQTGSTKMASQCHQFDSKTTKGSG